MVIQSKTIVKSDCKGYNFVTRKREIQFTFRRRKGT